MTVENDHDRAIALSALRWYSGWLADHALNAASDEIVRSVLQNASTHASKVADRIERGEFL